MEQQTLKPGFIGVSYGDLSVNAIIWGADGDFYFFPVDDSQVIALTEWEDDRHEGFGEDHLATELKTIFQSEIDVNDIDMFLYGELRG